MQVEHTCPYCHEPVLALAANAMKNATTQQWQHRDCWTPREPPKPPDGTDRAAPAS
jgi:hypothetical protein